MKKVSHQQHFFLLKTFASINRQTTCTACLMPALCFSEDPHNSPSHGHGRKNEARIGVSCNEIDFVATLARHMVHFQACQRSNARHTARKSPCQAPREPPDSLILGCCIDGSSPDEIYTYYVDFCLFVPQ